MLKVSTKPTKIVPQLSQVQFEELFCGNISCVTPDYFVEKIRDIIDSAQFQYNTQYLRENIEHQMKHVLFELRDFYVQMNEEFHTGNGTCKAIDLVPEVEVYPVMNHTSLEIKINRDGHMMLDRLYLINRLRNENINGPEYEPYMEIRTINKNKNFSPKILY